MNRAWRASITALLLGLGCSAAGALDLQGPDRVREATRLRGLPLPAATPVRP